MWLMVACIFKKIFTTAEIVYVDDARACWYEHREKRLFKRSQTCAPPYGERPCNVIAEFERYT